MSHLLIDRFRFDSFAPDSDEAGSNLLTRFGQIVYLFFMITPPASLVERAWKRGLDVGRYKAVDDTLAHGVEAYSGMPELFFTWVAPHRQARAFRIPRQQRRARRAAAHGRVRLERRAQRARRPSHARRRALSGASTSTRPGPASLYPRPRRSCPRRTHDFSPTACGGFARSTSPTPATGRIYARVESGGSSWIDPRCLRLPRRSGRARRLRRGAEGIFDRSPAARPAPAPRDHVGRERIHTLGRGAWADEPRALLLGKAAPRAYRSSRVPRIERVAQAVADAG